MIGRRAHFLDNGTALVRSPGIAASFFLLVSGWLLLLVWTGNGHAEEAYGRTSTRLVKIIDIDDSGLAIDYPSRVFFDHLHRETYVLSSTGRITIYDENFFPQGSIGAGRGAKGATGLAVGPEGRLFLCRTLYNMGGKAQQSVITIYNTALLVEREIFLVEIPELTDFVAANLAVDADGTIYLVGSISSGRVSGYKGAAILDNQGNFKGWLAPQAMVMRQPPLAPAADLEPPLDSAADLDLPSPSSAADFGDNLPAFLKPAPTAAPDLDAAEGVAALVEAAVALDSVYIDVMGRLYLVSAEQSEIFVYDRQGSFLHKFGVKGGANGKLSTPRSVAVDYPRRLVYVCDYMRHSILVYDYDSGRFVYEFFGKGSTPLWYLHPTYLTVDAKGLVIIADLFNRRVQVVDPTNPDRPVLEPIIPAATSVNQLEPLAERDAVAPAVSVKVSSVAPISEATVSPVIVDSTSAAPVTGKNIAEKGSPEENVVLSRQGQSPGAGKSASTFGDGGELAAPVAGGMSLAAKAGAVVAAPIVVPVALLAAGVSKLIGAVTPEAVLPGSAVISDSAPSVEAGLGGSAPAVPGKVASVATISAPSVEAGLGGTAPAVPGK
ncbi:MAG: hypothetical protein KAS94_09845, partial [Desulfobulbaceae bacterium]|nr:hypothetical protein [Desulfobulbaceae bacterium]